MSHEVTSYVIACKKPTHYLRWTLGPYSDTINLTVPEGVDPLTFATARVRRDYPQHEGKSTVEVFPMVAPSYPAGIKVIQAR